MNQISKAQKKKKQKTKSDMLRILKRTKKTMYILCINIQI